MASYYLKESNTIKIVPANAIDIHNSLPAGYYTTSISTFGEIYLTQTEAFTVPSKLYGSTQQYTNRILNTFNTRDGQLGAMFSGQKGSGKTLLARNICIEACKKGIPIIIVSSGLKGDNFNAFIQKIDQPAVVLFDEFEKNYDVEEQEMFLSLFDGTYQTKKLFLFTVNDIYKIQSHMRNRPGRIYYMIEFDTLEEQFIRDYLEDNLKLSERTNDILGISKLFESFSFDMLKAITEEVNLYNESISNILKLMNIKPSSERMLYDIVFTVNGVVASTSPYDYNGIPMKTSEISFEYLPDEEASNNGEWHYIEFDVPTTFTSFNKEEGSFTYELLDKARQEKYVLVLKPKRVNKFNFNNLI